MSVYDDIRPALDRLRHPNTAPINDFITYLEFEMKEIIKVLPPTVPDNASNGFHAGCCALRAYVTLLQLRDELKDRSK